MRCTKWRDTDHLMDLHAVIEFRLYDLPNPRACHSATPPGCFQERGVASGPAGVLPFIRHSRLLLRLLTYYEKESQNIFVVQIVPQLRVVVLNRFRLCERSVLALVKENPQVKFLNHAIFKQTYSKFDHRILYYYYMHYIKFVFLTLSPG